MFQIGSHESGTVPTDIPPRYARPLLRQAQDRLYESGLLGPLLSQRRDREDFHFLSRAVRIFCGPLQFLINKLLTGATMGPAATRQTCASFTWQVESPRSCRTPSNTSSSPCM